MVNILGGKSLEHAREPSLWAAGRTDWEFRVPLWNHGLSSCFPGAYWSPSNVNFHPRCLGYILRPSSFSAVEIHLAVFPRCNKRHVFKNVLFTQTMIPSTYHAQSSTWFSIWASCWTCWVGISIFDLWMRKILTRGNLRNLPPTLSCQWQLKFEHTVFCFQRLYSSVVTFHGLVFWKLPRSYKSRILPAGRPPASLCRYTSTHPHSSFHLWVTWLMLNMLLVTVASDVLPGKVLNSRNLN